MPGEVVTRPDAGLARGLWETSPSFLYVVAATLVAVAGIYLAVRLRLIRRRTK